jgi:hypothetical protein
MLASQAAVAWLGALGPGDRIPNQAAIDASPTIGWWLLACAICVVLLFVTCREHWRRFWLRAEDPRTIGLFRIVFALLVVSNTNDFWEYFEFLFSDEGIVPKNVGRQVFASKQFRGYGDGLEGEAMGFFDLEAWLIYFSGHKQSLLWFWDSPSFVWGYVFVFELITLAFMLGFRSRTTGFLSWGLMIGLYSRNRLFWEGTELVYFCFFFYLILAHSGRAYSIDNWLRCRRLRKQGRLSEPGGPGGGAGVAPSEAQPRGLEPIYRLIPSWPRKMMMLQLAAIYCYTGAVKTGSVWAKGDALYYAWNLDHFYRFYPQQISAVFGTNLFRFMTWVTHWWEACFPLLIVGIVARWAHRERVPMSSLARWTVRGTWVAFGLCALVVVVLAYPSHYVFTQTGPSLQAETQLVAGGWLLGMVVLGWLWHRLAQRPFRPARAEALSRFLVLRPLVWPVLVFNRLRGHTDPVDVDWFCRWFLGRRLWLLCGLLFHLNLQFLMNIGMFPLIMMATYIAFLEGAETDTLVRGLRTVGRRVLRRPGRPARVAAQDPALPTLHRDAHVLPVWPLWAGFALVLAGVLVQLPDLSNRVGLWQTPDFLDFVLVAVTLAGVVTIVALHGKKKRRAAALLSALLVVVTLGLLFIDLWEFRGGRPGRMVETALAIAAGQPWPALDPPSFNTLWISRALLRLALLGIAVLTWWSTRRLEHPQLLIEDERGRPRLPWGHGPVGRFVVGFGIVWHIAAVAIWLSPDKDSLKAFRSQARKPFATWLLHTHTDQSWGMFAPNPPRHNVFHKILVTDADGELWDLRTDLYAPERKPIPWIWNDRMRKMNRRIAGGESGGGAWYQKWMARWLCRDWALHHGGREPVQVELLKMSYRMPRPEEVRDIGWYLPEDLMQRSSSHESLYVETCADAQLGQLSDTMRQRYGLPALDGEYEKFETHRVRNWERTHDSERGRSGQKTGNKKARIIGGR